VATVALGFLWVVALAPLAWLVRYRQLSGRVATIAASLVCGISLGIYFVYPHGDQSDFLAGLVVGLMVGGVASLVLFRARSQG
jgi:hypothetical protein